MMAFYFLKWNQRKLMKKHAWGVRNFRLVKCPSSLFTAARCYMLQAYSESNWKSTVSFAREVAKSEGKPKLTGTYQTTGRRLTVPCKRRQPFQGNRAMFGAN